VSSIPPIEPSRPLHLVRFDDRPGDRDPKQQPQQEHEDPPADEQEDDGLPHIDVRA
jgi:hypothetical protein